ncbi:MAG TPA: hypothetical protein VF838_09550 [Trebonia sp.]
MDEPRRARRRATSTYFETGEADAEVARDWREEKAPGHEGAGENEAGAAGEDGEDPAGRPAGFREYGKSKDPATTCPRS